MILDLQRQAISGDLCDALSIADGELRCALYQGTCRQRSVAAGERTVRQYLERESACWNLYIS
jgi:hypothetical protein